MPNDLAGRPLPDAVVFDLDGTLIDTVGTRIAAWLASTIIGSTSSPSAATDVATWALRLDVAIAQRRWRDSMAATRLLSKGPSSAVAPKVPSLRWRPARPAI